MTSPAPEATTPPATPEVTPEGASLTTPAAATPPSPDATPPAADPPKPGPPKGDGKVFTQAELDALVQKRMSGFEKSFTDKFAKLFGVDADSGDGKLTPEKALQQMQEMTAAARREANAAIAESLARAAGIKDERIDTFVTLVDIDGVLKDVDDPAKAKAALKKAVDAKATEFAEWKGGAVAAASGGDRGQGAGSGQKTWTRDEISKLTQQQLIANADELQKAAAEGRIS